MFKALGRKFGLGYQGGVATTREPLFESPSDEDSRILGSLLRPPPSLSKLLYKQWFDVFLSCCARH